MIKTEEDKIFTTEELAQRWKCHECTVRRFITTKKLKAFRAGNWKIKESEIIKFEKENQNIND